MTEPAPLIVAQTMETPADDVSAFAEQLSKLVEIAHALVDSNRKVDLTGLESEIGLLCAKSLDLPPDEGRRIRPRLLALFGSVEGLSRAFSAHGLPSR